MKRPLIRVSISVLLMLAGGIGLLAVFVVLPYLVRDSDGEWMARHSERGQWASIQNRIRHFHWGHDDFDPVGKYGGKDWAEWIIQRLPGEKYPDSCESGHMITALRTITNISPDTAGKWPEDLRLWQAWWEQNRGKSQEQWIVDGFAAAGIVIQLPPLKEDWPALLKVLGHNNPKRGEPSAEGVGTFPSYLKYNAFRCLRDSSFNPVQYALEAELTLEIKAGLLAYRGMEQPTDIWDARPGRLFGVGDSKYIYLVRPRVLEPVFRWSWGSISVLTCLAGVRLWRRKSRLGFPPPRTD